MAAAQNDLETQRTTLRLFSVNVLVRRSKNSLRTQTYFRLSILSAEKELSFEFECSFWQVFLYSMIT